MMHGQKNIKFLVMLEVSAMGQSLVQRSPTERRVSEGDLETSTMRRPRPTRAVER
jgi:hypothetical protein